jgi:fatty-acyl-CoA synthase
LTLFLGVWGGFDGRSNIVQIVSFTNSVREGRAIAEASGFADLSVSDVLDRGVAEGPDRPLVKCARDTLSYGRTHAQARALAAAWHNLGVGAGDRVAIDLANGPEFVVSALAAASLGAIVVPLNPAYSPHELQFMLRNSEASLVVAAEEFEELDNLELFERMQFALPDLQYVVTVGDEDLWYDDRIFQFEDLVSSGEGKRFPPPIVDSAEDVYAILYTAGTTGKPKGVMLTHANLLRTSAAMAEALRLTEEDTVLITAPMFNIFGLGALMSAMTAGSAVAVMERFDPAAVSRLAEETRATVIYGAPTLFARELRSGSSEFDLASLRTGVISGAPVLERVAADIRDRLVPGIEIAYGLTETSGTVSITRGADPPEKRKFTAGRALDGVEVRVMADDGSPLPVESIGELAVRGFNVMKGYYRQPDETRRSFTRDGFLRTGDLGMVDEDGYVHIVGRKQDTIVRGEYLIYPGEIEDLLRLHPAVEDVAVVGVEDEVLGQRICACIVPVEGAIVTGDEVKSFCRGQVAQYKVPDLIRFVDSFPMTGSGKIRRVELARMVRAEGTARRS